LQGALLTVGLRGDLCHITVVDVLGISLRRDAAGLRERDFREVGFVKIDLNLQVFGVCYR
jgi:hypothetical protein